MTIPRIMLDLETLATSPNSLVLSIGAVAFDPKGGLGREFYVELERKDQAAHGRAVDPDTAAWWCQQSEEARLVMASGRTISLPASALYNFSTYCEAVAGGAKLEMWAHGADFDCVILGSLYEAYGIRRPWSYSGNRCYRTLLNMAKGLVEAPAREGVHHNALDDARYQAKCAVVYMNRLGVR